MKNGILVLLSGCLLMACHSQRKMSNRQPVPIPVEVTLHETVRDTVVFEEPTEPVKSETVVRTHGNDLMHYCIIVGTFVYEQNAVNLRNSLIGQGFLGTSIMQNEQGMYRVSAACDNSWQDAWNEVCRIRSRYPQFRDAWLLEVKDK